MIMNEIESRSCQTEEMTSVRLGGVGTHASGVLQKIDRILLEHC